MIRKLVIFAAMLAGAVTAGAPVGAYGGEVQHGTPDGKAAVGFATWLDAAEFRISGECPASPDRHTGWHRTTWVSYKTHNCVFNWGLVSTYFGLRQA
jgi:hypothetical protein